MKIVIQELWVKAAKRSEHAFMQFGKTVDKARGSKGQDWELCGPPMQSCWGERPVSAADGGGSLLGRRDPSWGRSAHPRGVSRSRGRPARNQELRKGRVEAVVNIPDGKAGQMKILYFYMIFWGFAFSHSYLCSLKMSIAGPLGQWLLENWLYVLRKSTNWSIFILSINNCVWRRKSLEPTVFLFLRTFSLDINHAKT